jgi:hypothetical protein
MAVSRKSKKGVLKTKDLKSRSEVEVGHFRREVKVEVFASGKSFIVFTFWHLQDMASLPTGNLSSRVNVNQKREVGRGAHAKASTGMNGGLKPDLKYSEQFPFIDHEREFIRQPFWVNKTTKRTAINFGAFP